MSKQYNTQLQERLEKFLKDENLSQAKAAPILGISQAALSQYRKRKNQKRRKQQTGRTGSKTTQNRKKRT